MSVLAGMMRAFSVQACNVEEHGAYKLHPAAADAVLAQLLAHCGRFEGPCAAVRPKRTNIVKRDAERRVILARES